MIRKKVELPLCYFPQEFHSLLKSATVYDSSCSQTAKVWYLEREESGYFLKSAAKGSLKEEAQITQILQKEGLAPRVFCYLSNEQDWLLTQRVYGEDATWSGYLANPKHLCDTLAQVLCQLHHFRWDGQVLPNRTEQRLTQVTNQKTTHFDCSTFSQDWQFLNAAQAKQFILQKKHLLQSNTLIHGDFCLPNVILQNGVFSGLIDWGAAGIGDPHFDLFWGAWSLNFNLKTDRYKARFFDAYGRDPVDLERLKLVAAIESLS